jgi:predicted ATPase
MATPKRQTKKNGKTDKKKTVPVYFLSLEIENVRCFGPKQVLDLSDGKGRPAQWTIVLGDNGVGKTTLLHSLVSLLPIEDEPYKKSTGTAIIIPKFSPNHLKHMHAQRLFRNEALDHFMGLDFYAGYRLIDSVRGKSPKLHFHIKKATNPVGVIEIDIRVLVEESLKHIVCFAYGASRRMSETAISDTSKNDATISLFSGKTALLNAEEWLLQADYSAQVPSSVQKFAEKQRDKIREILIEVLPDVTDIKFIPPNEEKMLPQVRVETPYGWVSIKDLSLGYKTLVAWMVDFARRMFELYPDEPKPLEQPAVVLVDEIDLHLHPKMQRELMSRLSKIFPNTQFIATAHSPLVVQAAADANIVLLRREGDHVVIDNDPQTIKGWRVDQILTSELFGLESARPPQYDAVLSEREKILSKAKLTKKDKERLHELAAKISEFPTGETPQDIEAMDIIRRAAERLKKQG